MSVYTENLHKAQQLATRNQEKIREIGEAAFWISDEKQADNTNQIKIQSISINNWLKVVQNQGHLCSILPIDGTLGVFNASGLPVENGSRFIYEWHTEQGIEHKSAGDCDCLILDEKWHFLEFKTDASSQYLAQINNNRNKAEAQLARSMASFREQFIGEKIDCICVMVVPKFFSYPKFNASSFRKVRFRQRFKCELKEIIASGNDAYRL